jgi:hypothetical protein
MLDGVLTRVASFDRYLLSAADVNCPGLADENCTLRRLGSSVKDRGAAGYVGGYSQVKEYVREARPCPAPDPVVRFEVGIRFRLRCLCQSRTPPEGEFSIRLRISASAMAPIASRNRCSRSSVESVSTLDFDRKRRRYAEPVAQLSAQLRKHPTEQQVPDFGRRGRYRPIRSHTPWSAP